MRTEKFAELFEGRRDVFGTDAGGCTRAPGHPPAVWQRMAKAHLEGEQPIGVYPMVHSPLEEWAPRAAKRRDDGKALPFRDGWFVKWGCVDFDRKSEGHKSWDYETEADAHIAAVNLQKVLKHLGVTSWIERTRSCGRHVWVFSSTWVPASTMRRSLLTATSVAGVSAREVNPKSEVLQKGQVGNYVRLPYPGALTNIVRESSPQVILGAHLNVMHLRSFVADALGTRTSPQTLEAIAAKSKAQEPERSVVDWEAVVASLNSILVTRLNATGYSVFTNGPNDGDRSRGMVYLAKQARLSGLAPSEALTLLAAAHWNKYRGRADEEKQLRDIVERAWT